MPFDFTLFSINPTVARCDGCIYWFPPLSPGPGVPGECHHGPPTHDNLGGTGDTESSWPFTTEDDACGQWFPKDHINVVPRCDTCMFYDPIEDRPLEEGFCVNLPPGFYSKDQPRVDPDRRCSEWRPRVILLPPPSP